MAGDEAFDRGDLTGARKHYESARPKGPATVVGLARVRIALVDVPLDYAAAKGNRDVLAAEREMARVVKGAQAYGPAFVELGIAVLATGHAAEAVRELGRAVELDPGSPARHGNFGTALMMAGRTSEAIDEYRTRARIDDADARAHSDLGTALLGTQDLQGSLAELERAVELDPRRAAFHSNLGYALAQSGHLDRAMAEYREALRLDPAFTSAWINLATALARDPKSRAEARAALERARSLSPSDPRVTANLDELDALEKETRARAPTRP
jgi:Flp pilus assembly protein TadD